MRRGALLRSWGIAGALLAASFALARLASGFIGTQFPDRPAPRDLLFELLPYATWPQYLTDVALITGAVLVIVHLARRDARRLPGAFALFGVIEIARAAIIMLTPLAGPLGNGAHYGLIHGTQNGEFPSGHVATVMLLYLLVDREQSPKLRGVLLGLVAVECIALLVSHGHYSIDIVGGLLLSAALHRMWTESAGLGWLKRSVTP